MTAPLESYTCDEENATQIATWLAERGGLLIWQSVNLSNPGQTWTTPASGPNGESVGRPNWQCNIGPIRLIKDAAEILVTTKREWKRFHVAIRQGSSGMSLEVTTGGSRRIRNEVARAEEKAGKPAWYTFDYEATGYDQSGKNCIIWVEDTRIPLNEWLAGNIAKKVMV